MERCPTRSGSTCSDGGVRAALGCTRRSLILFTSDFFACRADSWDSWGAGCCRLLKKTFGHRWTQINADKTKLLIRVHRCSSVARVSFWSRLSCSVRPSVSTRPASGPRLVEVLLEAGEHVADLFRSAEVCPGVGDGVVVLQFQQRR